MWAWGALIACFQIDTSTLKCILNVTSEQDLMLIFPVFSVKNNINISNLFNFLGLYECKVSTFFEEKRSKLNLVIYGKNSTGRPRSFRKSVL